MISHILVNITEQRLRGFSDASCSEQTKLFDASIATAKNGVGQQFGSECTPLGEHRIRAKIGAEQKINTCLLYTSPSPRDQRGSRMPSSA